MRRLSGVAVAAAGVAFAGAFVVRASADQARGTPAPRTTLSGIYTAGQASKGEDTYYTLCVGCHPKTTYSGASFKNNWAGKPLSDLYDWVLNKMPKNDPGTLTPAESVEVVAYILQLNKMPAGKTPLPANPRDLFRIRIELK